MHGHLNVKFVNAKRGIKSIAQRRLTRLNKAGVHNSRVPVDRRSLILWVCS